MKHLLAPLLAQKGIRAVDLAKKLGRHKSTITRWNDNGVPLQHVPAIEKATGIPRKKLRPDYEWGRSQ